MSDASQRLCDLQAADPQKFGYLCNNWRAAKEGLEHTDRTYARAADIHTNIASPSLTPRALGYTLQVLAELNVLDVAADRNAGPLYDLRTYDPDMLAAIGQRVTDE